MKNQEQIFISQKNFLDALDRANKYHNEKSVSRLIIEVTDYSSTYQEAINHLRAMKRAAVRRAGWYPHIDVKFTFDKAIEQLEEKALSYSCELLNPENEKRESDVEVHETPLNKNSEVGENATLLKLLEDRILLILKNEKPGELQLIPSLIDSLNVLSSHQKKQELSIDELKEIMKKPPK